MVNMSDTKDQDIHQLDCESSTILDIDNDIIDISALNFSDHDAWLQAPNTISSEHSVKDLRAWLRADVEQDFNDSHDNRRSIDTRTFTRIKKRSTRMSFESIVEANVWRSQASKAEADLDYSLQQKRQSTPPMLKPSNPGVSGICSANTSFTSGPESLEAFVTMSQSKGIDSFINLAEPEFSDALMNESSPSVLYSSLMSVTIKDDSPVTRPTPAANHTGIEDSQILTDSMMQTSMFGDVADVHFNDTFTETNSAEVTMLENAGYCSSNEKTFVATPETIENEPMNGTYNTVAFKTALQSDVLAIDPHASYIVSPGRRSSAQKVPSDASYVVDRESVNSASFIVRSATPSDASFVIRKTAPDIPEENCCGSDVLYSEHNDTFNVLACDATFDKIVSTSSRKVPVNSTFKAPESANNTASIANDGVNATFQARSPAKMDTTYQYTINSKFKAPESINDKLPLANDGVNATFQARSPAKMDTTYRHTVNYGNEAPVTNRYNTYRKSSTPERARNENYATNNLTVTMNDAVRVSSLENLDSTFCKPSLRIPRKLSAPLPLSRLPQSFQKSNPNLISNSLKSVKNVGRSAIPSFGYNKSARPSTARVEGGLTSKLYAMGKVKSDQRLEVKRNTAEFGMTGSGGSTDSIDSTQSAHSAPDFDDRLSSDGSNASYGTRMNIGGLQKINQLRENCLMQESTPRIMRPKRIGVLENTWVDATENLPSPILKNGSAEEFGSRSSSPHSIDSTIKTSSPLLSPVSSIQNINLASSNKDNNGEAKNSEIPINENVSTNKISEAAAKRKNTGEMRTGIRPPATWSSENRPASGIPRPASRIPAPRFIRPPTKINQGDTKKGL